MLDTINKYVSLRGVFLYAISGIVGVTVVSLMTDNSMTFTPGTLIGGMAGVTIGAFSYNLWYEQDPSLNEMQKRILDNAVIYGFVGYTGILLASVILYLTSGYRVSIRIELLTGGLSLIAGIGIETVRQKKRANTS